MHHMHTFPRICYHYLRFYVGPTLVESIVCYTFKHLWRVNLFETDATSKGIIVYMLDTVGDEYIFCLLRGQSVCKKQVLCLFVCMLGRNFLNLRTNCVGGI